MAETRARSIRAEKWLHRVSYVQQAQSQPLLMCPQCGSNRIYKSGFQHLTCQAQRKEIYKTNDLVYVCYTDHVIYNRTSALSLSPQKREAIGWLLYENDEYVTLSWDRDAGPPTIRNGDPKASGLVLLRKCILEMRKIG